MPLDLTQFIGRFRDETREKLTNLDEILSRLDADPNSSGAALNSTVQELMRQLHSIKGSARMMGFSVIDDLCHTAEDMLVSIRGRGVVSNAEIELLFDVREGVDRLLSDPPTRERPGWLDNLLAGLKRGDTAGTFDLPSPQTVQELGEPVEPSASPVTAASGTSEASTDSFVRVRISLLDEILRESRELGMRLRHLQQSHSGLEQIRRRIEQLESRRGTEADDRGLLDSFSNIASEIGEISNRVEEQVGDLLHSARKVDRTAQELRMRPIEDLFRTLPDQAAELARSMGKEVLVDFAGSEVRLDVTVVEALREPFIHLIRNAIDHGIELPEERERVGKKREGWLWISARENAGWAKITIADDGRGVDLNQVWARAAELGLTKTASPEPELLRLGYRFLFDEKFSSRRSATQVSGRGVGLAAVRRRIQELRGDVTVESEPGLVTRFIITMPASLSSQRILITRISGAEGLSLNVGIPAALVQSTSIRQEDLNAARSRISRGEYDLPRISLTQALFGGAGALSSADESCLVTLGDGVRNIEVSVAEVSAEIETVIEPLPPLARSAKLIAGAAILPRGDIMLILNVPALITAVFDNLQAGAKL